MLASTPCVSLQSGGTFFYSSEHVHVCEFLVREQAAKVVILEGAVLLERIDLSA